MVLRVFRHFVPVSIICLALSDSLLVFLAFRLIFVDDRLIYGVFANLLVAFHGADLQQA